MIGKPGHWPVVATLCCLFVWLAVHGLDQCQSGLATNRAWVGPCVWGWLLILVSPVTALFAVGLGEDAFDAIVYSFLIGISPTVAIAFLLMPYYMHWTH